MTVRQDGSIFAILLDQHARMRDLLSEVADTSGVARQQAFDALRDLLAGHEAAEEVVLRPVGRRLAQPDIGIARDGEERRIALMLAALEKLDVDSAGFADTFAAMVEAITLHTWSEEAEEFPAVQARLTGAEQRRLGVWTNHALGLAPTHPHPTAAGSPVAQWTVGPFTRPRGRSSITASRRSIRTSRYPPRSGVWASSGSASGRSPKRPCGADGAKDSSRAGTTEPSAAKTACPLGAATPRSSPATSWIARRSAPGAPCRANSSRSARQVSSILRAASVSSLGVGR
ncbi:MAG TPA: hemerythrin domain-containing protein [Actinospica sp.]|nr:hemerythrin domain-containing protein [Actinospica sp.]